MWNQLLDASFVQMRRAGTGESVLRSRQYTMPRALEAHVSHVFNVVELPLRRVPGPQAHFPTEAEQQAQQQLADGPNGPCAGNMKVDCWNYRYNQTTNDASGQSQMVFGEFLDGGGYMAPADLGFFSTRNSIETQSFSCPNGGCNDTACKG